MLKVEDEEEGGNAYHHYFSCFFKLSRAFMRKAFNVGVLQKAVFPVLFFKHAIDSTKQKNAW